MYTDIIAWNFWSQWGEFILHILTMVLMVAFVFGFLMYSQIHRWTFRKRFLKEFPDAHLFFKDQDAIDEIRRQIKKGNHKEALSMLEKLKLSEVTPFAYELAHFYAMLGDYSKCRAYLEISSKENLLPSMRTAKKEKSFKAISDQGWFDELDWMGKNRSSDRTKYYFSDGKKYYFSNSKLVEKPTSSKEQRQ